MAAQKPFTPALSHALIGVLITLAVGGILAAVPIGTWGAGAIAAFIFYLSRERRQSEEHFGSNRIWPWQWKPRAWRDMAWPSLAAAGTAFLIEYLAS
jgi:hypothetical protein